MKRIVNISLSVCKNKWYLLILTLPLAWLPLLGIVKTFSKQLWFPMKGRVVSLDRTVIPITILQEAPTEPKVKGSRIYRETFPIMIPENRKNSITKQNISFCLVLEIVYADLKLPI